jgi:hypothetical protein
MSNVIWCLVFWLMTLGFSIYMTIAVPNIESGTDWIDTRVESGQDRYGNCYLYVKSWQWIQLVECDRIGKAVKPVDKFGNSL